jgi:carbamate kinase
VRERRPLLVVAIGGNALSSPAASADAALAGERAAATRCGSELAILAARGYRLLVVHGNGPQVGRLLHDEPAAAGTLDIHVAQTQGELGYLLAAALETHSGEPVAALVTRVTVDPADPRGCDPEKPIGPVLPERPDGPAAPNADGAGWRRLVPSPWPRRVLELASVRRLLDGVHLVAGGGGGVPVTAEGAPVTGVVDKDRVAALLAIELQAHALLIGTDVAGACRDHGGPGESLIPRMAAATARRLLAEGHFAPGSMGPKVAGAADFAAATGRPAVICRLGCLLDGLDGRNGTRVTPHEFD